MDIIIGQYYKRIKITDGVDRELPVGALVLVTEIESDGTIHIVTSDAYTKRYHDEAEAARFQYQEVEEFIRDFIPEPDGASIRSNQREALLKDIQEIQNSRISIESSFIETSPLLTGKTSEEKTTSNSLVKVSEDLAKNTKYKINTTRIALKKMERKAIEIANQLKALASEQSSLLLSQITKMQKMVAIAEETMWTINIYLGQDEKVERLRKGKHADVSEKITIRQLVMYMDEECALAAEEGGIDIKSMESFDKWLIKDEKHLQQILPEQKGIVALKIRREPKDYGNSYEGKEKNRENLKTYWLIRNGENIYRVKSKLEVEDIIISRLEEFDELFFEKEMNWETHEYEKKALRPGSRQYNEAMEQVSEKNRHYLRILLLLQGILDRTPIFKPMPVERINLFDEMQHTEFIQYIYDGENSRLLGNGRESFEDMQRRINSQIEVGHRIIVADDISSSDFYEKKSIQAKWWKVKMPKSLSVYTLEKRQDRLCVMLESVDEEDRRVSFTISRGDKFFINFDKITIEEAEYYLADRVSRYAYVNMFPVLKHVIKAKKAEQEAEAPFITLLQSEMSKIAQYDVALDEVAEFVFWWKYKNFTHRSLSTNDQSAYTMILSRFTHSIKERSMRDKYFDKFWEAAEYLYKQAGIEKDRIVYIGHKTKNVIVLFRATSPIKDLHIPFNRVFVKEETYVVNVRSEKLQITLEQETRETVIISSRLTQWATLYEGRYFLLWDMDVRNTKKFLTEAKLQEAIQEAKKFKPSKGRNFESKEEKKLEDDRTLFITHDRKNVYVYTWRKHGSYDVNHLCTKSITDLSIYKHYSCFEKNKGAEESIIRFYYGENGYNHMIENNTDVAEWKKVINDTWEEQIIVWNESIIQEYIQEVIQIKNIKKKSAVLDDLVREYSKQVVTFLENAYDKKVYDSFMKENNNDEELWEFEKKLLITERRKIPTTGYFYTCLEYLIESGYDPANKTVSEILVAAKVFKMPKSDNWYDKDKLVSPTIIAKDFSEYPEVLQYVMQKPKKELTTDDDKIYVPDSVDE